MLTSCSLEITLEYRMLKFRISLYFGWNSSFKLTNVDLKFYLKLKILTMWYPGVISWLQFDKTLKNLMEIKGKNLWNLKLWFNFFPQIFSQVFPNIFISWKCGICYAKIANCVSMLFWDFITKFSLSPFNFFCRSA